MSTEKKSLVMSPKTQLIVKLVPPDGGWGWMVIIGTALSNIFNQSMLSLFSLLYGDALEAMGHETQGAALVLSTMLFVSNFGGPIAGAIVKLTSTRFVAVTGAICCTIGIFFSGFSTNIFHLVITYGVLLGLGLGFIQNSSFVAINSYFKLKKSRAVGLANVGTGVGQTLMPHLVRYLLEHYGFRGACLLLSSLSLHGIAGCMLIEPVERHMKKVVEEVTVDETQHLLKENSKDIVLRKISQSNGDVEKKENEYRRDSKTFNNKEQNAEKIKTEATDQNEKNIITSKMDKKSSLFRKLHDLFGIALLSDIRFINIVMGTALAVTSTQNFSMLYPFFLQNYASMDKQQTANCMSAVAAADIMGRLILPIFQDKYKIKARWMLIMTCIWLIVTRQILAYQTNLEVLLVMSALYGFGRSMIIVARNIAISENCSLDQVPAAVGLGMLTMGIIVPPAGYFLGWIRDFTNSYIACITAQNALLVVLLVTWIPDMLYLQMKAKRQKKDNLDYMS
ncbi:unnamed protein product [Arctia plantaginis]|uniref:Uncharacterized protein n=1 Tax=Arctia plantaginis TaxID=874455 RepID=A0A8S1A6C7_ARCPL|nr:unnamed protein product [Arctia plantaginis]